MTTVARTAPAAPPPMWRGVPVADLRDARQLLSPGALLSKPIPRVARRELELAGFTVPRYLPG
jgi:hypothetical protein